MKKARIAIVSLPGLVKSPEKVLEVGALGNSHLL